MEAERLNQLIAQLKAKAAETPSALERATPYALPACVRMTNPYAANMDHALRQVETARQEFEASQKRRAAEERAYAAIKPERVVGADLVAITRDLHRYELEAAERRQREHLAATSEAIGQAVAAELAKLFRPGLQTGDIHIGAVVRGNMTIHNPPRDRPDEPAE